MSVYFNECWVAVAEQGGRRAQDDLQSREETVYRDEHLVAVADKGERGAEQAKN